VTKQIIEARYNKDIAELVAEAMGLNV